jgi:hypothetical protein
MTQGLKWVKMGQLYPGVKTGEMVLKQPWGEMVLKGVNLNPGVE